MIHIDFLADVPEFAPELARAISAHWQTLLPEETYEERYRKLMSHNQKDRLPMAWVAHEQGRPLGTSALRVCDLNGREELTPWLAGVFVLPAHRGRGIASRLCRVAENHAWKLGYSRLYLHTPDQQALYRRLGWHTREQTLWGHIPTEIMDKTQSRLNHIREA
ncbi:GNAT family N-acetyltransferase [Photobacterium sp. MCCC 1A19761]|uniref:GNAT family N-acetyltransferase n=1 Tax=Photobacterium sp. MCCC 1A19761 TaxID=3115000 RepID=UPI00307DC6C9